jgi:hypothetical protein
VGPVRSFPEEGIEQVNVDVVGLDSLLLQGIVYGEMDSQQQQVQRKGLLKLDKGIDLELGRLGTAHREKNQLVVAEAAQDVLDMARVPGTEIVVGTHQAAVDGEMADDATVAATEDDGDGQHAACILVALVFPARDEEAVVGDCIRDNRGGVKRVLGLDSAMVVASAAAAVGEAVAEDAAAVAASART